MATGTDANEYFFQEAAPDAPGKLFIQFYASNFLEVRHMSTGTDFTAPFMGYPRGNGQYVTYSYSQQQRTPTEYGNQQTNPESRYVSTEDEQTGFDGPQEPDVDFDETNEQQADGVNVGIYPSLFNNLI